MKFVKYYIFLATFVVTTIVTTSSAFAKNLPKVLGVELLIADSSDNALESKFGHSLLRFIHDPSSPFEDTVLSFEADIPSTASRMEVLYKGASGDFKSNIKPITMLNLLSYYSQSQNRGLSRYLLRLKPAQIQKLYEFAVQIIDNPQSIPDYSFFNFNCARMVTWFFNESGVTLLANPIIPTSLALSFEYSLISPWQPLKVPSGSSVLNKVRYTTQNDQISIREPELRKLSSVDLFLLLSANYHFSTDTLKSIKTHINKVNLPLEEIYNIYAKEIEFYQDTKTEGFLEVSKDFVNKSFESIYRQMYWNTYFNIYRNNDFSKNHLLVLKEQRNIDLFKELDFETYKLINLFIKEH